jgi:hypothetical protein
VPRIPYRPPILEYRVFRGREAVRGNLLTPQQLRSSAWMRKRYNIYADARLANDHKLSCQAALLSVPRGYVLAGPSAAVVHGVVHAAKADDAVHVMHPLGRRLNTLAGIRFHAGTLGPAEAGKAGWFAVTSPARTAWDLARWLPAVDAVPIIDSLIGLGVLGAAELPDMLAGHTDERALSRVRHTFSLIDGAAQSPPESRLRVEIVQAGLPKPAAQLPVRVRAGLTLHPDLAWEEFLVAVEYDGVWHASADQLHRDRRRLNALVTAGWIVLHVTSQRMRDDMPAVLREIRAALRSRGWRG